MTSEEIICRTQESKKVGRERRMALRLKIQDETQVDFIDQETQRNNNDNSRYLGITRSSTRAKNHPFSNKHVTPLKESIPSKKKFGTIRAQGIKVHKKDVEECPICLLAVSDPVGTLVCNHKFCFSCILESTKTSTKCPCCRTEIRVIRRGREQEEVQVQEIVREEVATYDEDDYLEEPCPFCLTFDNIPALILCDRCTNHCVHVYCDPQLRGVMPSGNWLCPFCKQEDELERARQRQLRARRRRQ